jgi:hypothetical protein
MPQGGFYVGACYLVVRRRSVGGYSEDELIVRVSRRRPRDLADDEYVLPLKLRVPQKCLDRISGRLTVEVAQPDDAEATP